MIKHLIKLIILNLLVYSIAAIAHTSGALVVDNAWIREAPPNAEILAAYLEIQNHTAKKVTLTEVRSAEFGKIEMHLSTNVDGVAKMKSISHVDIPAEGKIVFAPGGLHLMLHDPQKQVKIGETFSIILNFSDGSEITTKITVQKGTTEVPMNHDHHEHEHHHDH